MIILAIETSCDETAVAIVKNGKKILSSIVYSQVQEHEIFGGVVPEIASRKHIESISQLSYEAIKFSAIDIKDIDAIAVTYSPGLVGSLLVGINFAKGLAYSLGKPLIAVNHITSHIAANYIDNESLKPPFICMVVSGGHTQIIEVLDYVKFKVIATTRDDAVGEVFDKVARILGLGYPGGVKIDTVSKLGDPLSYAFPHPKVNGLKNSTVVGESLYDFSFSGLKTTVVNFVNQKRMKNIEIDINNIAASFQKTAVDILCNRLIEVAKNLNYQHLAIAGGVSANSLLRDTLTQMCEKENFNLHIPQLKWCGDNAAMVGIQGYYEYICGNISSLTLNAEAKNFTGNI